MSTKNVEIFPFAEKRRQESGKRLKEAREKARYSQQKAGKILKVDRTTIGNWERGDSTPTVDDYLKMAELYEVNAVFLTAIDIVPTQEDYQDIENGLGQLERRANVLKSMQLDKGQSRVLLQSALELIGIYLEKFESDD